MEHSQLTFAQYPKPLLLGLCGSTGRFVPPTLFFNLKIELQIHLYVELPHENA